jgi:5-methylcytosine-specific restriction endonuclease McrA
MRLGEAVDSQILRNSHNTPTRTYSPTDAGGGWLGGPLSEVETRLAGHEEVRGLRAPASWGSPPNKREVRNVYVRRDDPNKRERVAELRRRFGGREPIGRRVRFRVLERCNFACSYCGRRPPEVELVIDHVDPVVLGGSSDEENLTAACRDCNAGKGAVPLKGHEPAEGPTEINGYPVARVRLKRGEVCWYWVIDRCPFCGTRHTHGGGPLDGDPRRLLGHRSQHCMEGPMWPHAGYMLVEARR